MISGNNLAKSELRKMVGELISEMTDEQVLFESGIITAELLDSREWKRAKAVLAYSPFGAEFDTAPLVSMAMVSGKITAFPKITGGKADDGPKMDFYITNGLVGPWELHRWGFKEPGPSCELFDPLKYKKEDILILCPGVAFDWDNYRLGRGGGYYDNYLARFRNNLTTAAPAFSCQMVGHVPREEFDLPVERIFSF